MFKRRSRWKRLQTIGLVVCRSVVKGQEKIEIHYCISSLALGAKQFAKVGRQLRSIESTCHWSSDVIYREDSLRTRQRCQRENPVWLRRFNLLLLKQYPGKFSLGMKRKMYG